MKIETYPAQARSLGDTVTPGEGVIVVALSDSGDFLSEAWAPTETDARRKLHSQLLADLSEKQCSDCGVTLLVKQRSVTAVPVCVECARKRIKQAKQREESVSLSNLSDAELGRVVRTALEDSREPEVLAGRESLRQAREVTASEDARLLGEAQERRRNGVPLPGFESHGIAIPALDLRNVPLDSVADTASVALYSALLVLDGYGPLNRESVTYRKLAAIHAVLTPQEV